ncbi:hypothetical protein [Dermabacter vaginalis]|uniref:Uncharacterized protein n=1 Tax=Dermabacter vaginalis TaxID=1630135 RepID=A0ABX6A6Q7_9MICO|nr:hypothetical protein [Dermabacter vaginalis]QEU12462.1 hypothetical protein FOB48_09175 [Dermabacter vaginalis]
MGKLWDSLAAMWHWLSVNSAPISALAAITAALLTCGLLFVGWKTARAARDTLHQMKKDSIAQQLDSARISRPYVYAHIAPSLAGEGAWDLILENTGKTAAYDIKINIEADGVEDDIVSNAVKIFAQAGTFLPPGVRLRTFWAFDPDEKSDQPRAMGYPRAGISLTYVDGEGTRYDDRKVILDPTLLGLTPVPTTGPESKSGANKEERNIAHALRAIAHNVGELNR